MAHQGRSAICAVTRGSSSLSRCRTLCPKHRRSYATHVKSPLLLPTGPPDPPKSTLASTTTTTTQNPESTSSSSKSSSSSSSRDPFKAPHVPSSSLPKPRIDYNTLLADPAKTTANHLSRKSLVPYGSDTVAHLKRLRDTQILLLRKLDSVKGKQKDISTLIKNKLADKEESVRQAKKLKARAGEYETNLTATEAELLEIGLALPNTTSRFTPLGPEENAVEIERIGPEPLPADPKRDHLDLAVYWDLVDNDASTTTTGGSWPFLKGTLALLEQALIGYTLSVAVRHGFTPVSPPDVVKKDIAWRCGFQPRDEAGTISQTYTIQTEEGSPELCLAGTSEIPLAGLFTNKILDGASLPQRVVGVGKAFRAEAGARGTDTRGLYRVHQFQKVELFTVCASENEGEEGWKEMDKIKEVQKEIVTGLGLSVRVLEMPTEELGASAARKWDMEAWMPGRGKWGEITSTSNCTDFQARRLHIRYRPMGGTDGGGLPFCHTLNGTAGAIPRLLVALLENGARFGEDGKVGGLDLPKVLKRFWVGGDKVGSKEAEGSIGWR